MPPLIPTNFKIKIEVIPPAIIWPETPILKIPDLKHSAVPKVATTKTIVVVINPTFCAIASLKITSKTSNGLFPVIAMINVLAKTPNSKAHKEL